ncbi:MAG: hypothetical protein DI536_04245 [Archangium gephyra]|uniref:DUF2833 domain-containing protein n=1 Tax=Archangium gephyra TaxID=48 RepID=A0A2W5TPM7_9BACT|nr:MAG: hypothetical protein DI536_04245 [Archangium gephyra]
MDLELVTATAAHAEVLGAELRAADAAECEALGLEPLTAPLESLRVSDHAGTALFGGRVGAMYGIRYELGVCSVGQRVGLLWLLTGRVVDEQPMAFHREAKRVLRALPRYLEVGFNLVDARHSSALRWLAVLGFRVLPAEPHGPHALPFHLVTRSF